MKKWVVLLTCLLFCPVSAADNDFELGLKSYKAGDYKRACESFENALKKNQKDPTIWYYDALCYHQMKNFPVAISRYKTLAKFFPNTPAGKAALAFLKKNDPSFAATQTSSSVVQESKSFSEVKSNEEKTAQETELDKELATLPDKAHFYFTKSSGGHMEVDLLVNGHPVKAEFDTGASALFYKEQLKEAGVDLNNATKTRLARGWAGTAVLSNVMPAEIKLGSLTRKLDITVSPDTGDLGHNLIGQDFIKGYQYEIDDKGGRVDLKKVLEMKASDINPLYDIPLTVKGRNDYIPMKINGKPLLAFIDTGAFATIISESDAKQLGITVTGEKQELMGVGGSVTMQKAYVDIQIGGLQRPNFQVFIGGAGGCAIGQDLMNGWRYKVDRKNKLLRFFH